MNGWQFVGFIPQGPKGDRYLLYAQRTQPNNGYVTIFGQLQTWDVETSAYIDQGQPEEFTALYDGHVHVGFWLPYMEDNGDDTITFFRQWYCRVSAESNNFLPEGSPQEMGTVALPPGPRGPGGGALPYY